MTAPIAITDTEGLTAAELARRGVGASGGIPAPASPQEGDLLRYHGGAWQRLPIGLPGQVLFVSDDLYPEWGSIEGGVTVRNLLRSPDDSPLLSPDGSPLITST